MTDFSNDRAFSAMVDAIADFAEANSTNPIAFLADILIACEIALPEVGDETDLMDAVINDAQEMITAMVGELAREAEVGNTDGSIH